MDMSDMDMSSSSTTAAASSSTSSASTTSMSMSMTFHTGTGDALWWDSWTPTSAVKFTFTLIFLVCLAAASRGLAAYMAVRERQVMEKNMRLANSQFNNARTLAEIGVVEETKRPTAEERALSSETLQSTTQTRFCHPWRLSVDLPRGLLHFVHAGLGYMLMLAVMSFNAGYFLAVVFGLLLGEVAFGRFAHPPVRIMTVSH